MGLPLTAQPSPWECMVLPLTAAVCMVLPLTAAVCMVLPLTAQPSPRETSAARASGHLTAHSKPSATSVCRPAARVQVQNREVMAAARMGTGNAAAA